MALARSMTSGCVQILAASKLSMGRYLLPRNNAVRDLRNPGTADVITDQLLPFDSVFSLRSAPEMVSRRSLPRRVAGRNPHGASAVCQNVLGTTLRNGIPVAFPALHDCGLVCVDVRVDAGSRCEGAQELGLAHFLEHMMFKGSRGLPEGAFDLRIEALGGMSNAATGLDDVQYHVLCPAEGASEAIRLLADLVLHPVLDHKAFRLEQLVVREELRQSRDQPEEIACCTLLQRACGTHRYGQPILGNEDSLADLTPAVMQAFHRRWYGADRLAVVVAGAVDPERCLADLERSSLGRLAAPNTTRDSRHTRHLEPLSAVLAGRTTLRLKRLGCARLMACWAMPPAASRWCISGLELAAVLLSEGRCSWLVARLREELGVVDDVDVDVIPLECGSLVLLETSCEASQAERVEGLLRQALTDWLQQPPRQEDLRRACRQVVNGLCFDLETAAGMATHLGPALLRRRLEPPEKEFERLSRWDAAGFHAQVMPHFALDQAHWLSVLPADNGP